MRIFSQQELDTIIAKHHAWLNGEEGGERANLRAANLRAADLSASDLRDADGKFLIDKMSIKERIAEACRRPGALRMDSWHTCNTVHCLAGWATTLHPQGPLLESIFGTNAAAALIFDACEGEVPNFYASNVEAKAWLGISETPPAYEN